MSSTQINSPCYTLPLITKEKQNVKSHTKKDFFSSKINSLSEGMLSIKDFIIKPSQMEYKLRDLKKTVGKVDLKAEDIQLLSTAFNSNEFSSLKGLISSILNHQKPKTLDKIIKTIFLSCEPKDAPQILKKVSDLLQLQKIELAIRSEEKCFLGAYKEALRLSGISSREIKEKAKEERATLIQTIQVTVENLVEFVLDTVLKAFQIDSIGEETEDDSQAYMRAMIFISICGSLATVFTSLLGVLGSIALTGVVGAVGILAIGLGLFCYYKWLKPCPKECSPFENLTTLAKKGGINEVIGRDSEIATILEALKGNRGSARRHPLIVAKSGAGKTTMAQGIARKLALKIYNNDKDIPKELRGKQIFYINIAKLCNDSVKMGKTKMDILAKVQKKMSRYKENCIFIFDEFATAFSDPNNQAVAANLLSFLDTSSQSFPYCIALTTDKEYYSSLATRTPIVRRTRPIPLDIMGKEATQLVLRHMFSEEAPEIEIDKSIYAEIYERTTTGKLSGQPQPSISQEILKDAINKAMTRKDLGDEIKKKNLLSQLLQKENKDRVDPRTYTSEGNEIYEDYDKVENELRELENKQRIKQEKYDKYFRWKRKQLNHRDKMVSKAIKIANIKEKEIQDKELKDFILEHHYITEALLSKVEVEKTKFISNFPEAKTCIDLELIIQVIEERIQHIEEENKKANQHIQEKKLENQAGIDLTSSALTLNKEI